MTIGEADAEVGPGHTCRRGEEHHPVVGVGRWNVQTGEVTQRLDGRVRGLPLPRPQRGQGIFQREEAAPLPLQNLPRVRPQPVSGRRQQDERIVDRRDEHADRACQAARLQRDGQVRRERVARRRPVVADQACQRRQFVRVGCSAFEAQHGRDVGQEQGPVQLVDNQVVAGEHDPVFGFGGTLVCGSGSLIS